jgi:hypothetical protein
MLNPHSKYGICFMLYVHSDPDSRKPLWPQKRKKKFYKDSESFPAGYYVKCLVIKKLKTRGDGSGLGMAKLR